MMWTKKNNIIIVAKKKRYTFYVRARGGYSFVRQEYIPPHPEIAQHTMAPSPLRFPWWFMLHGTVSLLSRKRNGTTRRTVPGMHRQ